VPVNEEIMRNTNNKKGFSLIELIVVMVLIGVIFTIGFSIYHFSSQVYGRETNDTLTQADLRTAISVITKDIRKHSGDSITVSGDSISIGSSGNVYALNSDGGLTVSGQVFLTGIESFEATSSGKVITIRITSLPDDLGRNYSYETTIARR
jgi:prepilin-type N-terminal cleavage/methylation domain-containing protein